MMNSITRSLNIAAILTKNKDRKQILFVNKTIYSVYTCRKPFSKLNVFNITNKDNVGYGDFVIITLNPQPKIPSRDLLAQDQQWKHQLQHNVVS